MFNKMPVDVTNDRNNIGIQSFGKLHVFGDVNVQSTSQRDMDLTDFDLPPLIETFRGRQQEIEELTNFYLNPNIKKVLICGLPGIGKTELAKQFANHCKTNEMVDKIFWVKVEQKEDLQNSFKPLKFIYESNKNFKIIFIFDNAVNRKTIFNIEPPNESNYFLLITSQEKNFSHDIKSLELDLLSFESGLEIYKCILMEYYNKTDRELYRQLGEIVGLAPLAVQVTAAFIRERIKATGHSFDLQEYIQEIKNTYFELKIPAWAANPYDKSISGAIAISVMKIKNDVNIQQRERELALNALFTCAFLDSENITIEALLEMPNIKQLLIQNNNKGTMLREALTSLDNFSFITYNPNGALIKIHRFIQTVLRFYISECDSSLQSKCYSACLESVLLDYKYFNKIRNPIILKYADENISIFYDFFLKYRKQFLINCSPAFKEILRWIIQWNCEHVLKKLIDDDLSSVYVDGNRVKSFINRIKRFFKGSRGFSNNENYIDKFGLLHEAALCDNEKVLKLLLQYDININKKETNYLYLDLTPLHIAAYMWNFEFMKILIDHNANINARDHLGNTPLFRFFSGARFRYKIDYYVVVKTLELLEHKHRNTRNYSGETILHEAAASCHAGLVMLLYNTNTIDINARDYSGYTPLHTLLEELELSSRGKQHVIETVKALKRCGARLDYKDMHGRTPRQLAKINNMQFLVPFL